ncbi:hypothetical protein HZS61_014867 [Fusarium oxysporum f. sp. conglutinans]|uniref:FAD-binding domain-containing protein n=1 Tax=Fusarium oxysporum f. sp. conglutinans TaxID=100902 RepID=A0A8H6LHR1_FUSOX|nr:hypothetical protein HZS61_014867 [Fusarium oxysporum f. sp. conglutinans]
MADQPKPIRVAVIGGGIAGLLLGQLLSSAPGIDAHVFERYQNEDSLSGYRIQLSLEILNLLKTHLPPETWAKVLPSVAKTPKEGYYHSCFMRPDGHVFYTYLPEEFRKTAAVSRLRLRKGLLYESEKWLTTGKKFTTYQELQDGTIKADFADESSHVCDLIVGADGITSRVRRTLLPSIQTVQTDLVIIYFKVPYTREVESMIPYKTGSLVLYPNGQEITIMTWQNPEQPYAKGLDPEHIDPETSYVMVGFGSRLKDFADQSKSPAEMTHNELKAECISRINAHPTHPSIKALVELVVTDSAYANVFRMVDVSEPWNSDNVTLVGDATFNMAPFLGKGAACAMEDAVDLSRTIIRFPGTPAEKRAGMLRDMAQRIELQYEDQGSGDRVFPLSFLDTYFMPVDVVLVINGTLDKDQLRTSLSKTLSLFPPVYGRFRRPSAATRGELSLNLYHPVPLYLQKDHQGAFYPSVWKSFINRITTKKVLNGKAPLLQITVTYLPHTSQTVLGVSFCHVLGDALSLYHLLKAWHDIHTQETLSISPHVAERIRLKSPSKAVLLEDIPRRLPRRSQLFSPTVISKIKAYAPLVHTIVFKTLEYARFDVSAEDLSILVQKARARLHPATCSTQDAFKAYLLKALNRFVYNGLMPHPRVTRIVTIVDARKARNMPREYFGNCITAVDTPYLPASKNLSEVAFAVREGVTGLTPEKSAKGDEWIQSIQAVNGLMDLAPAFDPDTLYVDDWTKVSMEEINFGQEQHMFCQPLEVEALPVRNWCMIYKAKSANDAGDAKRLGYQVQVSVPKGQVAELMKGIVTDLQEGFDEYFW